MFGKMIKINNARLSYPSLFQKGNFKGEVTNYSATLLIPKSNKKFKDEYDAEMKSIMDNFKNIKLKASLRDGDDEDNEDPAHHGCWVLKASSNRRPVVLDRDMSQITEDDDKIYAGCYVNAAVTPYYSTEAKHGKKIIYCNLHGIQFVKDGEAFGGTGFNPNSVFGEIGENEVDI